MTEQSIRRGDKDDHHKGAEVTASSPRRKRARLSVVVDNVQPEDFSSLDSVHPYGVLPGGNRFFSRGDGGRCVAEARLLNDDECWHHILGYCNGEDLGKLVQTNRFFYVAGHQPEIWRDLTLRKKGNAVINTVGSGWKDTYVRLFHSSAGKCRAHVPMAVQGVYSDYYYRLHSCRSFAIPQSWLNVNADSVPRVEAVDMTDEIFQKRYETRNYPVIIAGAASSWKAAEKWKDPRYCRQLSGSRSFRATSGGAPLPANFSLQSYYDYCNFSALEEAPLYLFDRTALKPGSPLWKDYMEDLQRTCPYWDPERLNDTGHDLLKILGEGRRPDHTWLIVGPKRSGSVFHIDPNATHAWNAAVAGRKRWIFYPPGINPPGVHPSQDGDHVALPLSVGEWIFQFWGEHVRRKRTAPPAERPLECTALPGDVIFVPHGWWHMVINLDPMNIAITHNYVSRSNLSNVLKFMEEKRDQVSGCRDRAESIKPEHLRGEFVKALRTDHSELLQEALAKSNWTCSAWKSSLPVEEKGIGSLLKKSSVMKKAQCNEATFSFSFL